MRCRQCRSSRSILCAALLCAAFGPLASRSAAAESGAAADPSERPLATEHDRVLYAIGVRTANGLRDYRLKPAEIELVERGMRDVLLKRDILVNESAFDDRLTHFRKVRQHVALAMETKAAREFVARAADEEGALVTEAGFVFFELRQGQGPQPQADSLVRIHFHGRLRDGTVWDSSVESGEPRQLQMSRLFPCGRAGLRRMRVGGRSRIVCPPELAFGSAGTPRVPGGAAIDFEVELLAIVK